MSAFFQQHKTSAVFYVQFSIQELTELSNNKNDIVVK